MYCVTLKIPNTKCLKLLESSDVALRTSIKNNYPISQSLNSMVLEWGYVYPGGTRRHFRDSDLDSDL